MATITGGTGPGGFELADGIGPLALWLDARDINADGSTDALANGSTINVWDDRSGYNRDASLVSGTPFYVAASAPGNNMPSVGFNTTDGTPDNLRTAFNFDGAGLGANYSIFAVSRYTGGSNERVISSGNKNWLFGHWGSGDERWYAEGWVTQAGGTPTTFSVYSGIIGPTVNGNAGDPGADFWKNGTQLANNNVGSSNTDYKPGIISLGRWQSSENSNAEVSELLIFNRYVNEAERRIIQNNLAGKYNLNILTEDVYAGDTAGNGENDLGIFGIGRLGADQLTTAGMDGFGIEATSALDDGDWVTAGNKVASNSFQVTGLPVGVSRRWARSFYVDVTDANNNVGATLAFDYSDAGLSIGSSNAWFLLTSADGGANWTNTGIAPTQTGDTIKFNLSAAQLASGLYTLGDASGIPLLNVTDLGTSAPLGGTTTTIDNALTTSDLDSPNYASATVRITSNLSPTDELTFTNQSGIYGSYTASSGELVLAAGPLYKTFTNDNGGFTVANGGPVESQWTYNSGAGTWSVDGTGTDSSPFVPSFSELNSAVTTVSFAGPLTLNFSHRYSFEYDGTRWDGGQVRVSVNGGAFNAVPAASFTSNGYIGQIQGNNILTGQDAFNGDSPGYGSNAFITSTANLGTFNPGDTIRVQFVGAWDEAVKGTVPNWEITSVNIQGAPVSVANYQTALRTVGFRNANVAASTATRTATFQVVDPDGNSAADSRQIVIFATAASNNIIWDGDSDLDGDGITWTDPANWQGNVLPDGNDIAVFSGLDPGIVNVPSNVMIGGISFTNGGAAYSINNTGGSLSLTVGTIAQSGSTSNSIAAGLNILAPATSIDFNVGGGTTLSATGNIAGLGNLNKTGTGTLALGGANTYTGSTNVNAGTLQIVGAPVVPSAPAGAAAIYTYDTGTTANSGSAGPTENGVLQAGASVSLGGGVVGGALNLPNAGSRMEIGTSPGISIAGGSWTVSAWFNGIVNDGDWNTLLRGGLNDHQIIIEAGTNRVGYYDNQTGTGFNYAGFDLNPLTVTGWHHIAVVGSGTTTTLFFDGAPAGVPINRKSVTDIFSIGSYQGGSQRFSQMLDEVYVYQSALSAAQILTLYRSTAGIPEVGSNNSIPDTSTVNVAGGAFLDLAGISETMGALGGGGTVTSSVAVPTTLTIGANSASATFSGVIQNGSATPLGVNKVGTGTQVFSGANTYSGPTNIQNGTLQLAGGSNRLPTSSVVTLGSGAFGGVLDLNNQDQTVAGLNSSGSGTNRVVDSANDATTPTLTVNQASGTSTYAGILGNANQNGFNLVKTGAGTLVLSGASTFTGTTSVLGGTLSINSDAALGTAPGAPVANQLTIANGATLQGTAAFTLSANRGITLGAGGAILDATTAPGVTIAGQISGGTNVTKTGGGDIVLTGGGLNNLGTLNINAGRIFFNSQNALGLGQVNINNGGTLDYFGGGALFLSNTVNIASGGNIASRNAQLTSNATLPTSGTLIINQDDQNTNTVILTSNIALSNALTIQVGGGGGNGGVGRLDGVISGNFTLTKTQNGVLHLNNINSYGGLTTVSAGTLRITQNGALGSTGSGTIVSSGATLELNGSFNYTDAEPIVLNGSGVGGVGALNHVGGSGTLTSAPIGLGSNASIGNGTAGTTFTINPNINLGFGHLTFVGAGNITVTGAIQQPTFAASSLANLNSLATGDYSFTANSQTFTGHVDQFGGVGWLMIGRGRNGWEFDTDGQGALASVFQQAVSGVTDFSTFTPAAYSDAIINDLLAQSLINNSGIEVRLKRAANAAGSAFQEVRWRNFTNPAFTFRWSNNTTDNNNANFAVTQDILASVLGGAQTYNGNTGDIGDNDYRRVFTWPWSSHGSQRGFAYGGTIGLVSGSVNNNFLWEAGGENHELPYTEVYIRSTQTAPVGGNQVIKNGTGTLTLSGNNTYTGLTTVNAGAVVATNNNALGTTAAGTIVNAGATLAMQDLSGPVTITGEAITAAGTGAAGQTGAIANISGNNTLASNLTLTGGEGRIGSAAGTLNVTGNINMTNAGLSFDGAGNILVSGIISQGAGLPLNGVTGELEIWLDATDINANGTSTADGALVSVWKDKSGKGRDFDSFLGDPNYVAVSTNGMPTVNFDGNDALRTNLTTNNPRNFIDGNGEFTLISVARYSGADRERVVAAVTGHNWLFGFHGNSTNRNGHYDGWGSLDPAPVGMVTDTNWHLHANQMNVFSDATNPAGDWWRDGVRITDDSRGTGDAFANNVPDGLSLGAWNGLNETSTSEVSELLMFNRVLSDAELNLIQIYLNQKYSLGFPIATPLSGVTKLGTGTVTLSGNNTFNAPVAVNAGTLVAASTNALGTTAAGTTVASGATLGLSGSITLSGEALTLNGVGAAGQPGALATISGNNIIAAGTPITVPDVSAGQVGIGATNDAGTGFIDTLTINPNIDLRFSQLVVNGTGDTIVNGAIVATTTIANPTLGNLDNVATGNYTFTTGSTTFTGHVDNDGADGWLLIGRGREGWQFDTDGQGNIADVSQFLGTTGAFTPAAYTDALVNALLAQGGINNTNVELRIRRATNTTGTAYQETRWRNFAGTNFTFDFDQGGGLAVQSQILSGTGSPIGPINTNTRDSDLDGSNSFRRIFTWAWGGGSSHQNIQGWSFGSGADAVTNQDPSNFLWEFGGENHAIPYTEIYIRSIPAVPLVQNNTVTKTGAGTLTLNAANTYTGPTNINGGVVLIAGAGTISTASTINVNNTGTLRFGRHDTWGDHTTDVSSPVVINAGGTLETNGWYNTLVNLTMNGGTVSLTGGANPTFPALALKGTVTVGGTQPSQMIVTSGANNFINIGDDNLGPTVFNVADVTGNLNPDLIISAPLQNNVFGAMGITKTGAGNLLFNGATSNTYTGTTILDNGILTLGKTGGAISIAGPMQMGNFNANQPNLRMDQPNQFSATTVMTFVNATGNWTRFDLQGTTQTLAGIQGTTGGGVIQNERLGGGGTTAPGTLIINNTSSFSYDGYIRDEDDGGNVFPLLLVKNNSGTQTLSNGASGARVYYTGQTTINNGALRLVNLNHVSGTPTFQSPITVNAPGTLEVNSTVAFATRWNYNRLLNGNGTFLKTGTGVFGITGPISMSGQINVNEGRLHNDNVTGNWAGNTADMFVAAGAVLDLRANDIVVDALTGSGEIWNSHDAGGGDNLIVGVANGSGFFNGIIRGNDSQVNDNPDGSFLGVIKQGTGVQTFSTGVAGARTYYTGNTVINNGTLELVDLNNAQGQRFNSNVTINSPGILLINSSTAFATRWNYSRTINGNGTLNKIGTGVFGIDGAMSMSGQINVQAGRLHNDNVTGNWSANTADMFVAAGAVLDLRANDIVVDSLTGTGEIWNSHDAGGGDNLIVGVANGSGAFSGIIRGNDSQVNDNPDGSFLGIIKQGTGTLTLSPSSGGPQVYYTGQTTINNGTLVLVDLNNTAGRLFNSSVAINSPGILETNSSTPFATRWNYGRTISGNGTWNKTGTGVFGIGHSTPGVVAMSGQINVVAGRLHNDNVTGNWSGNTADLNISAGAVLDLRANDMRVDALTGSGEIWNSHDAGGGDVLTIGVANGSFTYSGIIRGNDTQVNDNPDGSFVSVVKQGTGTAIFTSANTYSGGTNVQAGRLLINNTTGSGTGTGAVTVQSGATLGGDGAISGAVNVLSGGILAPGNSPGDLATGTLSLAAGANYNVEINGTVPGTQYDQTIVTGTVTLGGSTLNATSTISPPLGTVFVLIVNDGTDPVSGFFANAPAEMALITIGGLAYRVTYKYDSATNTPAVGNDVALVRNRAPIANAGSYTIGEGDDLQLDGSLSSDPDGDTLTYRWDVDGNGNFSENITGFNPLVDWATLQSLGIDDGPQTRTIYVEVNDGLGGVTVSTGTLNFQLNNSPPNAALSGPSISGPGQPVTFTFSATDPSTGDTAGPIDYFIDWGDGSPIEQVDDQPAAGITLTHTYSTLATFTVSVTARDKDGDTGPAATQTIQTVPVYQDTAGNVIAGGLDGSDDQFSFSFASGGRVQVTWGNAASAPGGPYPRVYGSYTLPSGARLIAFGQGGNDSITTTVTGVPVSFDGGAGNDYMAGGTVADSLIGGEGNDRIVAGNGNDFIDGGSGADSVDAGNDNDTVFGGAGIDTLNAGAGNDLMDGGDDGDIMNGGAGSDVMFGGSGNDNLNGVSDNDVLVGGAGDDILSGDVGRDILLGGNNKDTLNGGGDDDVLAGGLTAYDNYSAANAVALQALLAEWGGSNPYATRVTNLKTGGGATGGNRLNPGPSGVVNVTNDDGFNDTLTGGGGSTGGVDWFLASTATSGINKDTTDRITGETLN